MEQTIASHLLASFPEASANCQERPKWDTCRGKLGPGVGITTTSLWGGKIAKVDVQLTLLCSVPGQDSSCSVPCSEIGT